MTSNSPELSRFGALADDCSLSLAALNEAVKNKAFAERNAAKVRLDAHEQACSICTPKGELVGAHEPEPDS
jgi:hypothetical protein